MPDKMAFFDTSALVPLCVAQSTSQKARQIYRSFHKQIVAWTTLIEASGAIYRAVRLGGLNESNAKRALDRLAQLENRWIEIMATDRMRNLATDMLRSHDLRAGDAIQLASALVWCKEKPRNRSFVCFDQRLASVGRAVGFEIITVA